MRKPTDLPLFPSTPRPRTAKRQAAEQAALPGLAAFAAADRRAMLPLLARDDWAVELLADNPVLFFLLARSLHRYGLRQRQVELLSHMRRDRMLSVLGFHGTPVAVRFLRRCGFLRLDTPEYEDLGWLLSAPLPDWALHWKFPHLSLLRGLDEGTRDCAAIAAAQVLDQEWHAGRIPEVRTPQDLRGKLPPAYASLFAQLADIDRMIAMLPLDDRRGERQLLSVCHTRDRLAWLHDGLVDRSRNHWWPTVVRHMQGRPWPTPPVEGNAHIVPIDSPEMLVEEGYRMHHCVPSYADVIYTGHCYLYRVLAPQRATLYITRVNGPGLHGHRGWNIGELRLVCNGEPSAETRQAVLSWLRTARHLPREDA